MFFSAFRPAESFVCFERRLKPLGEGAGVREDSGAVLEAPGRGCTGRARCLSCTASAGSSWSTSPWWMSSWGCWPRLTPKGRAPWRGNSRGLNTPGCFGGWLELREVDGVGQHWPGQPPVVGSSSSHIPSFGCCSLGMWRWSKANTGAVGAPQERPFLPDPWQQSLNWGSAEALRVLCNPTASGSETHWVQDQRENQGFSFFPGATLTLAHLSYIH